MPDNPEICPLCDEEVTDGGAFVRTDDGFRRCHTICYLRTTQVDKD